MDKKRTYYGFTTMQQRQLLFKTWEETGSVTKACQTAHVSRGTYYQWRKRFAEKGYGGLSEQASREPHHQPQRKSEAIEKKVIQMHQEHPDWGKARIAQELAKANDWEPLVSLNTVRNILERHGLWPKQAEEKKGG
jgi:transposase